MKETRNCETIIITSEDENARVIIRTAMNGKYFSARFVSQESRKSLCTRSNFDTAYNKAVESIKAYEAEVAQAAEEQETEITEEQAAEEVTDPKAEYINWAADRCIKAADELENQYIDIVDVPAEDIVAVADEIRRRGHDHIAYGERNTECIEKLHSLLMHGWQMRRMVDLNEKRNRDWYEGSPEGKFIIKHAFMLKSTRERI